ncbi:MAG: SPOR domain-containing protein [Nitrospinota bacterium]|jgi:cell division protein FtsN|nr:SPOR domain-containing protein [Nitrospinota bacterium]HJN02553.1 SPOR domain-containing protein [Nitrospinota bacterium]
MKEDENIGEKELAELMEDREIEEEFYQEEKLRKKNARVFLISALGLLTIIGVYFGINYYNVLNKEEELFNLAELPLTDQLVKETMPIQEDLKKIEKKESALPKEEVKKKDENKTLPQKEDIEILEEIKKEKIEEKIPPPKKVDLPKKQIEEKASKPLSLAPLNLKQSSVEKISKPSAPSPQKATEILVPETSKSGKYYIQFGHFVIKKNADNLIRSLKNNGFSPSNTLVKEAVNMYRVYAGKFSELKMAREAIIDLENEGINARLKSVKDNIYTLQTGSFYLKSNAVKLRYKMSELGFTTGIVRVPMTMDVNKVYIGFFKTRRDAALYQRKLSVQGFSETLILNS